MSGQHGGVLALGARTVLVILALVAVLSMLEMRRLNEDRFMANLGVPVALGAALSVLPALILEIGLASLHRR